MVGATISVLHIVLTVVEVRGNRLRLGIEARKGVPVHRREVFDKLKEDHRTERRCEEDPA
jgi:carbon storage regulator